MSVCWLGNFTSLSNYAQYNSPQASFWLLNEFHEFLWQLAARIAVSNLHKNTKKSFSETVKDMYYHVNERSGLKSPLIADDVYDIIIKVRLMI